MNLKKLNVAELSAQEVRETEGGGGWLGPVLKELAKAVALDLAIEYVKEEWREGWNSVECQN